MATVIPTTGITDVLVRNTLPTVKVDIGGWCTENEINMFSRYKPVRYPHFAPISAGITNWWKAARRNCGIDIPSIRDIKEAGTVNWTYEKPEGGDASPYRMDDFAGYNDDAYPIIMSMYSGGIEVNKASGLGELSMMFYTTPSIETNLGIADIDNPELRNLYVYAELVDSLGITRIRLTGDSTLENGGDHLKFKISTLAEGQYTMYLCLSDTKQEQGGAGVGGTLYALYHDSSHLVKVPVNIVAYSPISFNVVGIGYSLDGPFMEIDRLFGGDLALETNGNVTFKCTLTAKPNTMGGGYRVADMVADVDRTFFDHSYSAGLFGRVFNESKQEVLEIEASAGESKTYYISGGFLDVGTSGAGQRPPSGKRIATGISIKAAIGNVTNKVFIGGAPFVAIAGGGDFIKDPGHDIGGNGDGSN